MSTGAKVTVVGAGNVGATCAQILASRGYAEIALVDVKHGLARGKALDINQMGAIVGYEPNVVGSDEFGCSAGSAVVVITAGLPRGPGMSRDELIETNEQIVAEVTAEAVLHSPEAVLVIVSNPLDAMCHVARRVSGLPRERVIGMAGTLDTARFRTFVAWETGSSIHDVQSIVLGGHGDHMVPLLSATTVSGRPLREILSESQIEGILERTAGGGGEIVGLLGTSAWYAPAAAVAEIVDAVVLDQKRVLPCAAYLEGEYGIDGIYVGVPVRLGARGIEEIVELELDPAERSRLEHSAATLGDVISARES